MIKSLPMYIIAGIIGAIVLFLGLTDRKFLFITDARWAVVTLAAIGFVMCSLGVLAPFITKAPAHPLTIIGYILGLLALFTGIVQLFQLKIPLISEPKTALIVIAVIIVIKFIIARFSAFIAK